VTTTTVKLLVYGDNHSELLDEADRALSMYMGLIPHENEENFIDIDLEPEDHNLSYEMLVSSSSTDNQRFGLYTAEVIARFKK
jgi:hypothetical protein